MTQRPKTIPAAEPATPRESAVGIILRRAAGGGAEILVGLRSRHSRFLPGHWACIGGGLEEQDRPDDPGCYARCTEREVREETGLEIPAERWHPAGLLITPPFFRIRYRTEFFVTEVDPGLEAPDPPPCPEELEQLRFIAPGDLLAEWERGEVLLPPVLPPHLRVLATGKMPPAEELGRRLAQANEEQESCHRIEFVPGIWMLPLRSQTLPPATHTNCWMPGGERFVVVDPGSADPEELERLYRVIRRRERDGSRAESIVLTHHHADHVAGARLLGEELDLPILAHEQTLAKLPRLRRTETLAEGDRLDLGGLSLEIWHTPGHAPGHIALADLGHKVLIAGDLLSGVSTIVIDPADGSIEQYCESLRRVMRGGFRRLFPSHGPPLPARAAAKMLEHREQRLEQVADALADEPLELGQIAAEAYADTPDAPGPLIELQTESMLLELARQGRAVRCATSEETWRLP